MTPPAHAMIERPGRERRAPQHLHQARRDLCARISDLLCDNAVDISPRNLRIAQAALSGSDPTIASALVSRQIAGKPIDQQWFDEMARLGAGDDLQDDTLDTLARELEQQIERFASNARNARDASCDYRRNVDRQLRDLAEQQNASELRPVLERSLEMVRRLRQLEDAIEQSRDETEMLRQRLALARREAKLDHLTGLPNRRAFESRLKEAHQRKAHTQVLVVGFCDVDKFKAINDEHGHEAGDRVLRAIAECLADIACDGCFLARHGGEEFALLFEDASIEEARMKVDLARRRLSRQRFRNRESARSFGRITISAGLAEVGSDPRDALARADAALYRAKQEGRDRVCVG